MKNILQRFVAKFAIITFFAAILISFCIFYLYNLQNFKQRITLLSIEENNILNRCGRGKEKFRFCAYPKPDFNSQVITWDENESYSGRKSLKLNFKGNNVKHYIGIHLCLTIKLRPYLKKGVLEFWLKGAENHSFIKNLEVYLKEESTIKQTVVISLPVEIRRGWQKISLPLSKFLMGKENNDDLKFKDKGFTWVIQEVLFSINSFNSTEPIGLFVDDLRITNNGKSIYALF